MTAKSALLTEVDDMNDVLALAQPDQEVVWFDIAVDKALGVHVFQSAQ